MMMFCIDTMMMYGCAAAASLQTEEAESEFLATHFDIAVQQFLRKCDLLFCFRHVSALFACFFPCLSSLGREMTLVLWYWFVVSLDLSFSGGVFFSG